MIVLDIETSGLNSGECGIWQIGALEFENPEKIFFEEAKIDEEDVITQEALDITGKTEEELRDSSKQTQKELILKFLNWAKDFQNKLILGQNISWDLAFIQNKCIKYGIYNEFIETIGFKGIDLFTISQMKYLENNQKFSTNENGRSKMGLSNVLELCGMKDPRETHNAIEDCKLEGECFSRLVNGKNLFSEYSEFKLPEVLKK